MKKQKHLYNVFLVRDGYGVYSSEEYFVGKTWASSKKQAENNVRYRREGKTQALSTIGDVLEEGFVHTYYRAELAEQYQ